MNTQPVFSNKGYLQPLEIRKGADFVFSLVLFAGGPDDPLNLDQVTEMRATLRQRGVEVPINFTCIKDAEAASGVMHLKLPRTITDTLVLSDPSPMKPANYDWTCDVLMTDGNVLPVCTGPVKIVEGETQWA